MGAQGGKYNLLFIHDDGATRSFRISRAALRLILLVLVLLPLLSIAGLWSGWRAWERGTVWTGEQQTLQRELAVLRVQLARLSHVEALMRLSETGPLPGEPGALSALVTSGGELGGVPAGTATAPASRVGASSGSSAGPAANGAAAANGADRSETTPNLAASGAAPAGTSLGNSGNSAASEAQGPGAGPRPVASASLAPETGPSSGSSAVPGKTEQSAEASNPDLAVIDKGIVSLNNVSARLGEDRRLRVRLDLNNESEKQVSGKIEYFIVTTDGQRTSLPSTDASFRISRLKKFVTSSLVPEGLSQLTNASLLVEVINSDGNRLHRQLYPISN